LGIDIGFWKDENRKMGIRVKERINLGFTPLAPRASHPKLKSTLKKF